MRGEFDRDGITICAIEISRPSGRAPIAGSAGVSPLHRPLRIDEFLAVGETGVDRHAGLAKLAPGGGPARNFVFEQVNEIAHADACGGDIAAADKGPCPDNLPAIVADRRQRLPDRLAGGDDIVDDQHAAASDKLIVSAM